MIKALEDLVTCLTHNISEDILCQFIDEQDIVGFRVRDVDDFVNPVENGGYLVVE